MENGQLLTVPIFYMTVPLLRYLINNYSFNLWIISFRVALCESFANSKAKIIIGLRAQSYIRSVRTIQFTETRYISIVY